MLLADLVRADFDDDVPHVSVSKAPADVSRELRRALLDDVLDQAALAGAEELFVTFPLGDRDVIDVLTVRCRTVLVRPAGSTCLADVRF